MQVEIDFESPEFVCLGHRWCLKFGDNDDDASVRLCHLPGEKIERIDIRFTLCMRNVDGKFLANQTEYKAKFDREKCSILIGDRVYTVWHERQPAERNGLDIPPLWQGLDWKCSLDGEQQHPKLNGSSFPPQFFQHSQQHAAAATIIQRTYQRTSNRSMQIIKQPALSSTCPTDFHIGHRVTVTSSHPTHAGKTGTVCRYTKKYVMFMPDEHPTDIICILPTSLAAYHLDG